MTEVNSVVVELPDGRKHTWKNAYFYVWDDGDLSIRREKPEKKPSVLTNNFTTLCFYSKRHFICVYNEDEQPETTEYVPPIINLPGMEAYSPAQEG